ncbi:MAG: DUF1592 domain-containing protein [Verrucomicrobiota bacterium]
MKEQGQAIKRAGMGLVIYFAVLLVSESAAQEVQPKALTNFLSEHCFDCHDDILQKGKLNLLDLAFEPGKSANFKMWQRIHDRVQSGEMPPKKKDRPAKELQRAFLKNLKEPLMVADRRDKKERGRVQLRRLTRREYENTVRDLLGVGLPLQDLLPEDTLSHGFETVAEGQQLSHYNLASYLQAADLALNQAFDRVSKGDQKFIVNLTPKQLSKHSGGNYRGPEARGDLSISWPIRLQFYGRLPATRVKKDGWYRITLKQVHAINAKYPSTWGTLRSGACNSSAPILHPIASIEATAKKRDMTFDAWIRADDMLELKPNDSGLKAAPSGAKGGNVSYQGRDMVKLGFQGIAISGIKIERIYPQSKRWEMRQHLFAGISKKELVKLDQNKGREVILKKVIGRFASRAFRRPLSDEQVKPYLDLALSYLAEPGHQGLEALRVAYRGILCSPRFLTLVEKPGHLDDHALASRLSYALWVSMPDATLRKLADAGKLHQPKVWHAQIDRMLDDPKAQRFINSFTDQWLNLKEIDFTSPDRRLYRTFDSVVQDSMLRETRAFFQELVLKNYPIKNLIQSDFVMLNERLARFYRLKEDLPLVAGGGLQKISLSNPAKGVRSGLVTQGAVLKVSANGTTTSPVIRGLWVGERILGLKVPPPPADTPAIEPDIRGAVSIRDQLEKHRSNESCATCHRSIDPAGFALENFDPVGLWRKQYGKQKNAAKVDSSGVTPEGKTFADINGWKRIYLKKEKLLTENFTRQFLTYATGAAPRFSDRDELATVVKQSADKNYRMRDMIHAILGSELFQSK